MKRPIHRLSTLLGGSLVAAALAWPAAPTARGQIPTHAADAPRADTKPADKPQTPAAAQDESFPTLQRRLADAMTRGDVARAIAIAERQHKLFPNEMKATADLGDAYLVRGDTERAEPLLRAAIAQPSKLYTSSVASVLGTIYADLGQIALAKGRTQDAISHLQRAVDYAPTTARARFMLASAFALAGQTDRSTREIRAAFDVDSSAARAGDYLLLVRSLRHAGNAAAAADAVQTAVKRYPLDADLRVERAGILRAQKRPAVALSELLYVRMLLHPGDARAAAVDDQIAQLRAEAEAASADPDPELEGLVSYLEDDGSGQPDEALPTIQDVVAADPAAFVPRLLLARTYAETGRLAEAERVLTELVGEDQSSVPALAELANLYYTEGRREAARQAVDRARRFDPDNPRLREVVEAWKP